MMFGISLVLTGMATTCSFFVYPAQAGTSDKIQGSS